MLFASSGDVPYSTFSPDRAIKINKTKYIETKSVTMSSKKKTFFAIFNYISVKVKQKHNLMRLRHHHHTSYI